LLLALATSLSVQNVAFARSSSKPHLDSVDAINSTTARLDWSVDNSNRGFRIQVAWSGTGWQNGPDVDKNTRTFDYGGLAPRTTYKFRVCQRSGSSSGNCSNAKSVRTPRH
jgi:hypothetical protein